MSVIPLVRAEFARLTASRIGVASLIALMTVPVVYGALYLWGNQDPYSNLDQVPAAIVIDDAGTIVDGAPRNYGQDAADTLLDDGTFGWVVVTDADAAAGVIDGTYDFAITFPTTFSADIASSSSDAPTQAELQLTTNDTNSYLSTTLAKQAAATVRTAIASNVGEAAAQTLLDGISDIRDGLVDATDGAAQLADGATTAATGASDLSDGLAQLRDGASALPSSTEALKTGAAQVASGLSLAATGTSTLATNTAAAAALAPSVRSQVATAFANAGVDPAVSGPILAQLDGLTGYTGGINSAVSSLNPKLAALSTGAAQIAAGTSTLAASAPSLSAGLAEAAAGAATLADGTSQLADGSTELSDSLASGLADVPSTSATERSTTAAAIGDPVTVQQQAVTEAGTYGAGLAPFFLSLAAWIGIYALFLIIRPLSRRALTAVRAPVRTVLAGYAVPALLGVVQMVALFLVAIFALRLDVANAGGLLAFMVFVSATF
ncbi:YhgE/Pip domain-containing protein, partial [Pseudolysinimonas sp.]|uniref:YhgE/Pip domain-containing protein n=1 Tax=Pseudolysinimonas sp. TaxID=2680009 RepID=UPI003782E7F4